MTSFEDIMKTIYVKKAEVENQRKQAYYLVMSKNIYLIFLEGMSQLSYIMPKDSNIEFFEGMEIIAIPTQEELIEVKGINIINV